MTFLFPLPECFLEQIGYQGSYSLVGMHWEPIGDELTVYDPERLWCGQGIGHPQAGGVVVNLPKGLAHRQTVV